MGSRRRLCSNLRTPRGSLRTTSLGWQFMMSLPLSSKQCCPAPVRNRRLPFVHSAFSLQREFPIVYLWYSTIIKMSSGPYFVKPLGFLVVRFKKYLLLLHSVPTTTHVRLCLSDGRGHSAILHAELCSQAWQRLLLHPAWCFQVFYTLLLFVLLFYIFYDALLFRLVLHNVAA